MNIQGICSPGPGIPRQRGVATLAIGVILLVLITLVSLYGMRVTILEQRVSANDYRSKEAYGAAQAGLSYGIEFAKSYEGQLRSNAANGWLDGTRDLTTTPTTPNLEWSAPVDCKNPADSREQRVCDAVEDSGLRGSVRLFDAGFDVADESTYGVPIWPGSGSGAFSDCPGGSCRAHVELILCEFDSVGDDCTAPAASTPTRPAQYAILVLGRGESADGAAQASVRQMLAPFDEFPGNTLPPLMAASNVDISGTLNIVVNPDGAGDGTGIPISGWSNDDLVMSGTASFCYQDEYFQSTGADLTALPECDASLSNQPCSANVSTGGGLCPMPVCDNCSCPTSAGGALTRNDGSNYVEGIDVLDHDGNDGPTPDTQSFPPDVFRYIFGVDHDDYPLIKNASSTTRLTDCSSIDSSSSGLYWVSGSCSINSVAGSPDHPVIIVTEGDFSMAGGGTFFGIAFAFSPDPSSASSRVTLNGGPEFYGTIVSDHNVTFGNGNFDLIYSKCLFDRIATDDTFKRLGPVPGSWADHI